MRYLALATDYDGTLAQHGRVSEDTWTALERLRDSGRKALLVTGRELPDLHSVCPRLDLFERVVAENGGLLYHPATREERVLGPAASQELVRDLQKRGVGPVSVGRTIIATREPHETAVLQAIHDLGLEAQVIFNKGAVMVLPAGVNKASGLAAALGELGLSPHNAVGVGDAENDHAFLGLCECAVAVANALPLVQKGADFVTRGDHGRGVVELIEELLSSDLGGREAALTRHHLLLGRRGEREVRIPPYGGSLLVAGPSGSGKSTTTTGVLERLAEAGYQFCVIDPEGDYENLPVAVTLGSTQSPPVADQVLQLLRRPGQNVVVNLLGIPLSERPPFFAGLLPRLQELRAQAGRPHWLVLDEAHHLLPSGWDPAPQSLPQQLANALLITVHPDAVSPTVLNDVETVVAVGDNPADTLARFARAVGERPPKDVPAAEVGQVVAWSRTGGEAPFALRPEAGRTERRRHSRKYAEGELSPDRSFYFRGPAGKLNLRSHNLILFVEMAAGVDEDTWLHHLRQGDYSRWFREAIKDPDLAGEAEEVEADRGLPAAESRKRIREAIERHYTLAATTASPGSDLRPAPGPLPVRE